MEKDNMMNVNAEMEAMKGYISEINYCAAKVREVRDTAQLYQANVRMNIWTALVTVYALACGILRFNMKLMIVGAVLIIVLVLTKKDYRGSYKVNGVLSAVAIVSSIACFMFFYTYVPVFVLLVEWLHTVSCNYNLKKQVWKISNGL